MLRRFSRKATPSDESGDGASSPPDTPPSGAASTSSPRTSVARTSARSSTRVGSFTLRSPRASGSTSPKKHEDDMSSPRGLVSPRKGGFSKEDLMAFVRAALASGCAKREARMARDGQFVDGVIAISPEHGIFFYKNTTAGLDDVFDVSVLLTFDLIHCYWTEVFDQSRLIITHASLTGRSKKETSQFAPLESDDGSWAEELMIHLDRALLIWMHGQGVGRTSSDVFDNLLQLPDVPSAAFGFFLAPDTRNSRDDPAGTSDKQRHIRGKRFVGLWIVRETKATMAVDRETAAIVVPSGKGVVLMLPVQKAFLVFYWRRIPSFGVNKDTVLIKVGSSDIYCLNVAKVKDLEAEMAACLKRVAAKESGVDLPFPTLYPPMAAMEDKVAKMREAEREEGAASVSETSGGSETGNNVVNTEVGSASSPTLTDAASKSSKDRTRGELVVGGKVVKRSSRKHGNLADNLGLETDEMKTDAYMKETDNPPN